jgi:hypothetical protein
LSTDSNSQQFIFVVDIYIDRQHAHGHLLISPSDYEKGDLPFGTLEHLTTTPPSKVMTTLCRRITRQVHAGQVLHFTGILPGATLTAAHKIHGPMTGSRTFNYIFGYIGSYQYCIEFSTNNTNFEQRHDTLGHLLTRIEEIP